MKRVDVLVVGLGPAGASAAREAARQGAAVLAADARRQAGVPVQCGEWVPPMLHPLARKAGALVQAVAGMRCHWPSGTVESVALPGWMISRARFDAFLVERARLAGAEVRLATRLVELDGARSKARLRGPEGEYAVTYGALVAADGPLSSVARLLGLAPLETMRARQVTVSLAEASDVAGFHFSSRWPGGYGWCFPRDEQVHVGVGFHGDGRTLRNALENLLTRLGGPVGRAPLAHTGGAVVVGGLREDAAYGNVLFAGDAAGLTHPLTGGGIPAALASGEWAGRAAARGGAAWAGYAEELRDVYGPAFAHALARRGELARSGGGDADFRRAWPGFPEYHRQP